MALARWEIEQRRKGNNTGADLAQILREKYGDISLNSERLAQSFDLPNGIREHLRAEGLDIIYRLSGKTIRELRDEGNPFWSTWHLGDEGIEELRSKTTLVAVNSERLFLPNSDGKTLSEQLDLLNTYSLGLQSRSGGLMSAIIGEAADYAELTYGLFEHTGRLLFGPKYENAFTRTSTKVSDENVIVGNFGNDGRLCLDTIMPDSRSNKVAVAPLVTIFSSSTRY